MVLVLSRFPRIWAGWPRRDEVQEKVEKDETGRQHRPASRPLLTNEPSKPIRKDHEGSLTHFEFPTPSLPFFGSTAHTGRHPL